jgi:hypothetical protein
LIAMFAPPGFMSGGVSLFSRRRHAYVGFRRSRLIPARFDTKDRR